MLVGLRSESEVAHEAQPALLVRISGRDPKADRFHVTLGHDCVDPDGPADTQASLGFAHEGRRQATAATARMHCKSVEAAAPPVPGGDHGPNDLAIDVGDEERLVIRPEQAPKRLVRIRHGWIRGRRLP